jgi:uncharacterized membrane protein
MGAGKIERWHRAGLIDADTRDRLIAHEAAHARPFALWAVFGIGALAIGLGLVSVVAANWEDIPGQLRLGLHLALIAGALAALVLREQWLAQASPWAVEALLFVTVALGLTFFGHLGQVYQTGSPLWKPLAAWLALFAPLLLLTGRSWPAALTLVGGAIWCAGGYATGVSNRTPDPLLPLLMWLAFVIALPVLFAPLSAWARGRFERYEFWRRIEQIALAYAVASASFACTIASIGEFAARGLTKEFAAILVPTALALVAGAGVAVARRTTSGPMAGAILAATGPVLPLAYLINDITVLAAGLFMALWAGIAAAALAAHWRGVFQLAVAAISLRLIILSFELAGDLLTSGFGLILAGLMILGVAWLAVRVSKRLAPREGDAA